MAMRTYRLVCVCCWRVGMPLGDRGGTAPDEPRAVRAHALRAWLLGRVYGHVGDAHVPPICCCLLANEWNNSIRLRYVGPYRRGCFFHASRMALFMCAYDLRFQPSLLSSDGTSNNSRPGPRSGLRPELLPKQEQRANLDFCYHKRSTSSNRLCGTTTSRREDGHCDHACSILPTHLPHTIQ